eukprot:gb/GECH01001198.1/.p1 GENE.gb/GECH01001198.1/~~gb/GECH01001198.1/.p1  ORF type:complete len:239 (+),score=71.86 gb/GECH01001198.1/:1-717(+)
MGGRQSSFSFSSIDRAGSDDEDSPREESPSRKRKRDQKQEETQSNTGANTHTEPDETIIDSSKDKTENSPEINNNENNGEILNFEKRESNLEYNSLSVPLISQNDSIEKEKEPNEEENNNFNNNNNNNSNNNSNSNSNNSNHSKTEQTIHQTQRKVFTITMIFSVVPSIAGVMDLIRVIQILTHGANIAWHIVVLILSCGSIMTVGAYALAASWFLSSPKQKLKKKKKKKRIGLDSLI